MHNNFPILANFIHDDEEEVYGLYALYTKDRQFFWTYIQSDLDMRFPTISGVFDTSPILDNEEMAEKVRAIL